MKFLLNIFAVAVMTTTSFGMLAQAGEGRNGGFADASARTILKKATKQLSLVIANYSSELEINAYFKQYFGGVPAKFNRAELARMIREIQSLPDDTRKRAGRDLMFDYGVDAVGRGQLYALKPFFSAYVAWSADLVTRELVQSLMQKLLHEASHTWGFDETQAGLFSKTFIYFLQFDGIDCYEAIREKAVFGLTFQANDKVFWSGRQPWPTEPLPYSTIFTHSETSYSGGKINVFRPHDLYDLDLKYQITPSTAIASDYAAESLKIADAHYRGSIKLFTFEASNVLGGSCPYYWNPSSTKLTTKNIPSVDFDIQMDATYMKGTATIKSDSFANKNIVLHCESRSLGWMSSAMGKEYMHGDESEE